MEDIKSNLIKALENVSTTEGIVCIEDTEHDLGIIGKCIDDYLAIGVLSELLKDNKIELNILIDKEDKRMKYLYELLLEKE